MKKELKLIHKSNGVKCSIRPHRTSILYPNQWLDFWSKLSTASQRFTFDFLLNTGARINEARNVRVCDIDLPNQRLVLRVTKVRAANGETTSLPRTIPISSEFTKRLKKHISQNELKPSDYIRLLSTPASNIAMKIALERAGIVEHWLYSVHNIRKTTGTWLCALGVQELKVLLHLGHNRTIALKHYLRADAFNFNEKELMRKSELLGDLYKNVA